MKALIKIVPTVGGQAVWAMAQAAIVVVLSSRGQQALIGVYVFGLAVFAPLCLVGSLNLRTSIALGRHAAFASVRQALLLRAAVVVVALAVTLAVLAVAAHSLQYWICSALLIGIRAVDNISEVMIGFYQRDDRQALIARSFFLRGAANILPFLAVFLASGDHIAAIAVTLATTLGIVLWHDVLPALRGKEGSNQETASWFGIWNVARRSAGVAPFPVLDNLHFNSFRFAMFLGTSPEFMGLVGVAQTLFVPFQLVATAIGFGYLHQASRVYREAAPTEILRHMLFGVGLGFAVTFGFLVFASVLPSSLTSLIFGDKAMEAAPVLKLVALAMLPIVATGYAAMSLVASDGRGMYNLAPAIAIVFFWICFGIVYANGAMGFDFMKTFSVETLIAVIFFGSSLLRLILTLGGILGHCAVVQAAKTE